MVKKPFRHFDVSVPKKLSSTVEKQCKIGVKVYLKLYFTDSIGAYLILNSVNFLLIFRQFSNQVTKHDNLSPCPLSPVSDPLPDPLFIIYRKRLPSSGCFLLPSATKKAAPFQVQLSFYLYCG